MRLAHLLLASGLLLMSACLCGAQTDAEAVKEALDALLTAAKAGDAKAAGQYVHELALCHLDPDNGVMDRQAFLDSIKTEPAPAGMSFGDYEPEVYGDGFVCTFMERLGVDDQKPITMNFLSSTTMSPWLTATERGNYVPALIEGFRATVLEIVAEFRAS